MSIGDASKLIGERDVHVAIGRLGELRHFGRFKRLHLRDRCVEHTLVEGGRARQAWCIGATNELRIRGEVAERLAGEHTLWREAAEHLCAALFGDLCDEFARGADRHRCFENHEQVVVCAGNQRFGCANERLVGDAAVVAHEDWHDNKRNVGVAHGGRAVDGGAESARANVLGKELGKIWLATPRRNARVNDVNEGLIDVDGMHAPAVRGELQGEW